MPWETFNGCFFNLGSLDQPGGLAGGSYQHMYGDEARLLKFEKLKKNQVQVRNGKGESETSKNPEPSITSDSKKNNNTWKWNHLGSVSTGS